jgi:hypothetical protein
MAVPVRTPSGGGSCGYPHLAVVRNELPVSIRRQPLDEHLLVDFGARLRRARLWSRREGVHLIAGGRRRRRQGCYLGLLANRRPFDDAAAEGAYGESGQDQAVYACAHVLFSALLDA